MSHSPVRVRFAPSPTGFLHIGGVRTALFCWLYARKHKGQFLLRIEDTDVERSEDRFTQDILSSMKWLGLDWDEDPIFQSRRMAEYQKAADQLVAQGHAYHCTCTEADVEKMREVAMASGQKPMYDRRCREQKRAPGPSGSSVIRLKIPLEGSVTFDDLIRGPIEVANTEVDDFVLIRSNGAPTYNLSVVVDDLFSHMTHIIRGDDHINNTPKQIHLYRYLGAHVPHFAHLPMILGQDKKKLSKRNGVVSANAYRADGYLPEALLNFLARIGWSHGDQEFLTIAEMIEHFSFEHVQKSSGVFNAEKLLWLSGEHIKKADPARLVQILCADFSAALSDPVDVRMLESPLGLKLVGLIQPKVKTLKELAEQLIPLLTPGTVPVDPSGLKWNKDPALKQSSQTAASKLMTKLAERAGQCANLAEAGMGHDEIGSVLKLVAEEQGIKLGDFTQPLRLTVTGKLTSAAGLFDLLPLLPWKTVKQRLEQVSQL